MSKKIEKPIKTKKSEKNNQKNQINRLKNHKKVLVWFGFQSLKPIEPNWFNQASTKKKKQV
jgi:hypothetical protein